jgi:hypothetical protein
MSELKEGRCLVTLFDATGNVVTSGEFESEEAAKIYRLEAETLALEIGGHVEPRKEPVDR